MAAEAIDSQEQEVSISNSFKKMTLIIGAEEFVKINVSNRLHNQFDFQVTTKDNLAAGIQELTNKSYSLVVLDIDGLDEHGLKRFYKLVMHIQVPTMLIGSDINFLNKLRLELENDIISFLPKTIINSMLNETLNLLLKKANKLSLISNRVQNISKFKKPKSLYLLATLLMCEPIIKIFYLKFQTNFTWDILFRTVFGIEGFLNNIEFWAIFPLASIALISVRSWSFFFFIGLQFYSLFQLFTYEKFTWPYVAENPHISSSLLVFFNTCLIAYFLIPENRRPYWNASRRLWRNTSRYATSIKSSFSYKDKDCESTITNISKTGAYFTTKEKLEVGHTMRVSVELTGKVEVLDAIVRRAQDTAHKNYFGYGIEFIFHGKKQKHEFKNFVEDLNIRIQ